MWTDDQLPLLIDERKTKNTEYHNIPGSSRVDFWNSIANTINQRFGTTYTGQQCNNRFQNLVRDYNVSAKFYIHDISNYNVLLYWLCLLR